jgi:hypothetical protein
MELAQSRMIDLQKNLGSLAETALNLAAKQEADNAVAHIKERLPRDVTGTETSAEDTHTGLAPNTGSAPTSDNRAFTPLELAALYKFPTQFNGAARP